MATALGDAYIREGSHFSACVTENLGCGILVVKYALAFLDNLWDARLLASGKVSPMTLSMTISMRSLASAADAGGKDI